MVLFKFVIYKQSNVWHDAQVWNNWYIIDIVEWGGELADIGRALAAMERTIHQAHVEFTHVVCWRVTDSEGDPLDEGVLYTTIDEMKTFVFKVREPYRYGTQPNDYEGMEGVMLRVSFDFSGARSGYKWYQGVLAPSDLVVNEKGETALKEVYNWRIKINDYFAFWYGFNPGVFYVQRTGGNLEKFGPFTQVFQLVVRGATVAGGIKRAKTRIPLFRIDQATNIMTAAANIAEFYELFVNTYNDTHPFCHQILQSYAIEILELCFSQAASVLYSLQHKNDLSCDGSAAYLTRFGPTSDALIGAANLTMMGACGDYEPAAGISEIYGIIVEMEPTAIVGGIAYFTEEEALSMLNNIELYALNAYQLARGDYMPSNPRAWPPLPIV